MNKNEQMFNSNPEARQNSVPPSNRQVYLSLHLSEEHIHMYVNYTKILNYQMIITHHTIVFQKNLKAHYYNI